MHHFLFRFFSLQHLFYFQKKFPKVLEFLELRGVILWIWRVTERFVPCIYFLCYRNHRWLRRSFVLAKCTFFLTGFAFSFPFLLSNGPIILINVFLWLILIFECILSINDANLILKYTNHNFTAVSYAIGRFGRISLGPNYSVDYLISSAGYVFHPLLNSNTSIVCYFGSFVKKRLTHLRKGLKPSSLMYAYSCKSFTNIHANLSSHVLVNICTI